MNNELDFNYSECIKSYDTIGKITYVNICNNESYTTPWGVCGWLLIILIITTILFFITFLILTIKELIFNKY